MKIPVVLILLVIGLCSFYQTKSLAGRWEYAGDIFNGKKEAAPTDYALIRKYTATNFEALVIQKGYKTGKYEAGKYSLNNDSCFETQTFCSQPSKLLNITVNYHYTISNDTLTLQGILPDGEATTEYWKRVK
jgi:hypothetical protein